MHIRHFSYVCCGGAAWLCYSNAPDFHMLFSLCGVTHVARALRSEAASNCSLISEFHLLLLSSQGVTYSTSQRWFRSKLGKTIHNNKWLWYPTLSQQGWIMSSKISKTTVMKKGNITDRPSIGEALACKHLFPARDQPLNALKHCVFTRKKNNGESFWVYRCAVTRYIETSIFQLRVRHQSRQSHQLRR
jgi:hypothetical protein